jgi:amino acid transporter
VDETGAHLTQCFLAHLRRTFMTPSEARAGVAGSLTSPRPGVVPDGDPALASEAGRVKLGRACLSYSEVLAQSLSVIAPSTVPGAVLGLIYMRAGNATWVSFALGTVGLVFVSLNINQFARRSASPASLYGYIVQGLGPTAGFLGAWALLFGYTLTGMSTLCGFALIANVLLAQWLGIRLPVLALFALAAIACFYIAFRNIRLSARTMLTFEGLSLLFVLVLGARIWSSTGFAIDRSQFTLGGATPNAAFAGVMLVVFAFSGFESSTALGDEAKDPLEVIPRSVIQSVLLAGLFFIATSYVVVLGFERSGRSLAHSEAPLNVLATATGWRGLGAAISLGILMSFFSCTLASINSTARIMFAMSRHGLFPQPLGAAHARNGTPHVAVGLSALITFSVPAAFYGAGVGAFDCQGMFGTLCSFGFIVVYILISVAAPVYLSSVAAMTRRSVAYSAGAVAFMLLPLMGALGIHPGSRPFVAADAASGLMIGVFALYVAGGLGWLRVQRRRHPKMISRMKNAIELLELEFAEARNGERLLMQGNGQRP